MKFAEIQRAIHLAKTILDAGIALSDARRRGREEKYKRADDEKDKKIKELEAEVKLLKEPK